METINVKELLGDFEMLANNFPENLKPKMQAVCNEHPENMADELLFLSEEILSQFSAYGLFLNLPKGGALQIDKNNDKLPR